MIRNNDELRDAVTAINVNIQAVQDYLGQNSHADGKIRFPRGFLRTAPLFRSRLGFVSNEILKRNLSYALILSDVLRWIVNRTDLGGTAQEMVIKNAIILMASISESIAVDGTKGVIGKKHSFCERTNRMESKGIISADLRDRLHWLWAKRDGIHIYELNHQEYGTYDLADYNKAVNTTADLRTALEQFHAA